MSPSLRRIRPTFKISPGARAALESLSRRILACALTAVLLCSAVPQLSAQRRISGRVPAGAESQPVPSPGARKNAARKGKQRASNTRTKARGQDGAVFNGTQIVTQDIQETTVGVPWAGEVGIQQTTEDIMSRQANAPAVSRRPLLVEEHHIPNRRSRPQDPNAQPVASTPATLSLSSADADLGLSPFSGDAPPAEAAPPPSAPQTLSTTFNAVTGPTESGFPPDTMGSVGPTQFVLFVNGRLRTFNKTTGAADGVINADPDVFFSSVMTPAPPPLAINFTSDPQVRYDRLTARWIMIIIDVPSANDIGDTPNRILIAVSDAASAGVISAGTVWTFYFVQQNTVGGGDSGGFCDYPSLGVDANALYTGCDEFGAASGSFVNTTAFVIRKSSVLSGGPVVATAFRNLIGTDGPFEPRGVDNYDPAAAEGFFIGSSAAAFGRLIMRRVGTPAGTPTLSANIPITVSATAFPVKLEHLGNTVVTDTNGDGFTNGALDALDDRLMAAHIRNGRLWTSHAIAVTAAGVGSNSNAQRRNAIRWYELVVPPTTGTPTVNQSGTIFDSATTRAAARQFIIPSVMVSGQGHAALGYTTAGNNFRINAATNGRFVGDTLGTTGAVNIYTASSTAYNPAGDPGGNGGRRWGDYSFTTLDPKDDMTMWTVQQYCNGTNTYGEQVVKLLAPPPPAAAVAVPPAVVDETASTNVVVTGTAVAGTGYYDPGTDLAPPALPFNHIAASVTGGVTVTSITYNSPTQVTLNLSTVGATPGPQNLTITNPDGQQATYTAAVTVTAAPAPAATAGQVLISEFRFRGSGGAADEFVELYNNTNNDLDISGYTLHALTAAGAQSLRFTAPGALASSTTVIPARGHFLLTGASYSLSTTALSNGALSADIVDGSSVGFFAGATPTAGTRIDSAGFDTRDALFFEGTAVTPSGAGTGGITADGEYSFSRAMTGPNGESQDTGNNNADFIFVSTTAGTFTTRPSILGAPGPENLASPVMKTNAQMTSNRLDTGVSSTAIPNRVRTQRAACPPASSPTVVCDNTKSNLGAMEIRLKFTNNTGAPVTRLRFRIVNVTTLNNRPLAADADLRLLNNAGNFSANISPAGGGGSQTVQNLTLEAPSDAVTFGGGINSTLGAGTITVGTPLANGATINVNFMLGVQLTGNFRFFVNVEALP
jgi:hypothetical protein